MIYFLLAVTVVASMLFCVLIGRQSRLRSELLKDKAGVGKLASIVEEAERVLKTATADVAALAIAIDDPVYAQFKHAIEYLQAKIAAAHVTQMPEETGVSTIAIVNDFRAITARQLALLDCLIAIDRLQVLATYAQEEHASTVNRYTLLTAPHEVPAQIQAIESFSGWQLFYEFMVAQAMRQFELGRISDFWYTVYVLETCDDFMLSASDAQAISSQSELLNKRDHLNSGIHHCKERIAEIRSKLDTGQYDDDTHQRTQSLLRHAEQLCLECVRAVSHMPSSLDTRGNQLLVAMTVDHADVILRHAMHSVSLASLQTDVFVDWVAFTTELFEIKENLSNEPSLDKNATTQDTPVSLEEALHDASIVSMADTAFKLGSLITSNIPRLRDPKQQQYYCHQVMSRKLQRELRLIDRSLAMLHNASDTLIMAQQLKADIELAGQQGITDASHNQLVHRCLALRYALVDLHWNQFAQRAAKLDDAVSSSLEENLMIGHGFIPSVG